MGPQVVWTRFRDLEIDERAERQDAGDEDQSVDLRRVPSRAANGDWLSVTRFVFGLANCLDEHLKRLSHQRLVLAERD